MRILCLGDVLGRAGRTAVMQTLPALKQRWKLDFVVVNGENAASGFGINANQCRDLLKSGVDVLTLGDHAFDQRDILTIIDKEPRIVRALNYPDGTPGSGAALLTLRDQRKVLVVQAMGRVFMDTMDDPFRALDRLLASHRLGASVQAIIVDVHAEATSEKGALGQYLDGRVSLVFGTHTHIPTSDTRILPKGTGFQTDLGMCGDYNSVIGFQPEASIKRFLKKVPSERFTPATGEATLSGVFVETDDKTGLVQVIEPVRLGGCLSPAEIPEPKG